MQRPACIREMPRRHERIARIVSFAKIKHRVTRAREELPDDFRNARARLIHAQLRCGIARPGRRRIPPPRAFAGRSPPWEYGLFFPVGEDALGDAEGDFFPVIAIHHGGALGGVADEAALHQHGGIPGGGADHVEVRALHTAAGEVGLRDDIGLDVGRQQVAVIVAVVGLDAVPGAAAVVVVVHADEDGVAPAVAQAGTVVQRDEDIRTARQNDMQALRLEQLLHTTHRVQREMLLIDIADARSAIMTAMARIKDHRIERMSPGQGGEKQQGGEGETQADGTERSVRSKRRGRALVLSIMQVGQAKDRGGEMPSFQVARVQADGGQRLLQACSRAKSRA